MKLTNNTDFFQKRNVQIDSTSDANSAEGNHPPKESRHRIRSNAEIIALVKQTSDLLDKCGFRKMSARASQIMKDTTRERFVVSVVGEFNHGKSTFLNRLLENAAMLPVDNLPTTAVLTRIRYANESKMAIFDDKGVRQAMLSIAPDSWKGLVANNFAEEQPKGSVIVGVPNSWLGKHNIEIIDCPGAGDLSEERAKVIGDVLCRTDGAIIALNATAALSNSERLFIKNRILSRKTPFTLIIVNKLDLVKKEERSQVVKYIMDVLTLNKMDMPIYIPYDIEMPDDTYSDIIGMDKVKKEIVGWVNHPGRQQLIETWIKARAHDVIGDAIEALVEQEKLLRLDDDKRKDIIVSKKQALNKLEIEWNNLTLKLQAKSNDCYARFLEKVEEYTLDITERLQYEVSHAANPERWWKEDYPYRLKVELANLSVGLENTTSRIINNDVKWFNDTLNQKFRSFIQVGSIYITDKEEYKNNKSKRVIKFENLSKKQNYARVGTVALSLALAPALGLVATMGVGTAGTLITSKIFKKKIEEQRIALKEAIVKDVPAIIMQATANSEKRIQKLYDEMIADSDQKRKIWLETQQEAIEKANPSTVQEQLNTIAENITNLTELSNKLS